METPKNFSTISKNQSCYSSWDTVEGADGYILRFYRANKPSIAYKTRYAQGNSKVTRGFENGKRYLVDICAFRYVDEKEERGPFSEKVAFVPFSNRLSAQEVVALRSGETFQLKWDYQNTTPIVQFYSEDPDVAKIDESGLITACKKGKTAIKITMLDPYGDAYKENDYNFVTTVYVDRDFRRNMVENRKATICLVGDLMCGAENLKAYKYRNYDFSPAFRHVRSILNKADYSVGVLETMCDDAHAYESDVLRTSNGRPNNNSPSTFIGALKDAGFDGLVTAQNHNCDAGMMGLETTVNTILNYEMDNIGTMSFNPVVVDINGISVAFIALSMITNGLDRISRNAEVDLGRYSDQYAEKLIGEARNMGADYIIAVMHWGKMNSAIVDQSQISVAGYLAEKGVDLIVGSESHIVQRMEYITNSEGKMVPCIYSMGNFYSSMKDMVENSYSYIAKIDLSRGEGEIINTGISLIPCFIRDENEFTVVDIAKPTMSPEADAAIAYVKKVYGVENVCFVGNDTDGAKILAQGSVVSKILNYGRINADTSGVEDSAAEKGYEYFVLDLLDEAINNSADEMEWRNLMDIYSDKILNYFNGEKVILIRMHHKDEKIDKVLVAMEAYFIETARPIVVDVAGYYSYKNGNENDSEYEPLFYEHCSKIISNIIAGTNSNQFYFSEIDEEIWMKRVLMLYKQMDDSSFSDYLLDMRYASDVIVDGTSFEFVACYQNALIELKKLQIDFDHVETLIDRPELSELISAVKIIKDVRDNPDEVREPDFYEVGTKYNFKCIAHLADQVRRTSNTQEKDDFFDSDKHVGSIDEKAELFNSVDGIDVDIWGSSISKMVVSYNDSFIHVNKYIFKQPCVLFDKDRIVYKIPEDDSLFKNNPGRRRSLESAFERDGKKVIEDSKANWIIIDLYDAVSEMLEFKNGLFEIDDYFLSTDFYAEIEKECSACYLHDRIGLFEGTNIMRRYVKFISDKYGDNIILIKSDVKTSYKSNDGKVMSLDLDEKLVRERNIFLRELESVFEFETNCYVIDIARYYYADDIAHRSGGRIVHYEEAFYKKAGEYVTDILNGSKKRIYGST